MYKQKITQEQKDRLKAGDRDLLRKLLVSSDTRLIAELKTNKDDTRFLQGAAHIIDNLLKALA